MSLYPSLEDMKVDQMIQAQIKYENQSTPPPSSTNMPMPSAPYNNGTLHYPSANNSATALYPSLSDYMGLELSEEAIAANMPDLVSQVATLPPREITTPRSTSGMVAPLSGQSLGLKRAQVTHGIRELTLCKDANGKVGLRVKSVNNGVFVCLVTAGSPGAMAGLRFGDQILQINNVIVAGYTMDQVHDLFRKSPVNGISVVVRDRPFERTITLYKDSAKKVGFQFKNGKIVSLVKDSSAARNGLLTEHHLLEVNGQNVVGLKDKETTKIIENGDDIVTITIIPSFIYDHMIKKMATALLKDSMDHSIPNI